MNASDLLPNINPTSVNYRRLRRKYRVCKLSGHIYYMVSRDDATGHTVIECRRCWPHRMSRKSGYLYDLLPVVARGVGDVDDSAA